jgi:predicted transcriptional regulator
MECMSNLTIRIPEALRKELQDLCRRQKRPVSQVVRDSLRRYVAVEKFQTLRRRALPLAEAQGLLTDEDVFKAVS